MSRLRVAVVCPYAFDVHGGVQDQVRRIVGWLRDSGHQAWAVAPGESGPEGTRHLGAFRTVPANRSKAPISVDPRVLRRVGAAVADADVVHVHEPFMPMVSLGAVMADTPPKVATFHAHPEGAARRAYRLARPVLSRLASRIALGTAVSRVAAAAVEDVIPVRIIPNGIDLSEFRSDGDGDRRGAVFLGRDEPRKGLDVLLQAWPLVRKDAPGAALRVVGASRESGPAGVTFVGPVSEADKRAELSRAAVLVAPNLGGESFGIVVLEGLASGCAVVASDLAGFRAVAGEAAAYVPPDDPVALATMIAGLLGDRERRRALAETGRRRAEMFDREVVLGAYLLAYEEAMGG